jgi:predicted dinucleotide-binding enzyme
MKLAIIGAGNVGGTLGKAWAEKGGHDVCFGVRDPKAEKTQMLVKAIGPNAQAASLQEAAVLADVIVLATPWPATESAIRATGDLKDKILLDATNPLEMRPDGLGLECYLRRRESAGLGDRRFRIQNTQHHWLCQHGESCVQWNEIGDVRRRR